MPQAGRAQKQPEASQALQIRPTSDRARESLFNVLTSRFGSFDGLRVADLYAGTGALGFEALSRGAASLLLLEKDPTTVRHLEQSADHMNVASQCEIWKGDGRQLIAQTKPFDLVMLDPPYGEELVAPTLEALASRGWVDGSSLIVAELDRYESVEMPPGYNIDDDRTWGRNRFLFLNLKAV